MLGNSKMKNHWELCGWTELAYSSWMSVAVLSSWLLAPANWVNVGVLWQRHNVRVLNRAISMHWSMIASSNLSCYYGDSKSAIISLVCMRKLFNILKYSAYSITLCISSNIHVTSNSQHWLHAGNTPDPSDTWSLWSMAGQMQFISEQNGIKSHRWKFHSCGCSWSLWSEGGGAIMDENSKIIWWISLVSSSRCHTTANVSFSATLIQMASILMGTCLS